MEGYLGEQIVDISKTKFAKFTKEDWAIYFIGSYGQIDGAHHKQWVLDQVARILLGTPIIVKVAKWENGTEEYRERLGEPSTDYLEWVEMMKDSGNYFYDEGITP